MHSNCGKINKTLEICMELFFRTIGHMLLVVTLGELSDSSNTFAANLNMKAISFFTKLVQYDNSQDI